MHIFTKGLFLLLALFIFPLTSFAQIAKGHFETLAKINYNVNESNSLQWKSYEITPQMGYFVSDEWRLGVYADFGRTDSGPSFNGFTRDIKHNFYGLYSRKYVSINETFYFLLQPQFEFGKNEDTFQGNHNKIGASLGLGFIAFLSNHFALELFMPGFEYAQYKSEEAQDYNELNANVNLSNLAIGFVLNF